MPARVTCPHCHHDLRLPDALYYRSAQCPVCEGGFRVSWRPADRLPAARSVPAPAADEAEDRRPCRFCGQAIKRKAQKCPFCGEWLKR